MAQTAEPRLDHQRAHVCGHARGRGGAGDELLEHVARDAGVALSLPALPRAAAARTAVVAPGPGAVFMCGYPIALGLAPVMPIAAPIPAPPGPGGARSTAPT